MKPIHSILIVDDEPLAIEALEAIFETTGVELMQSTSNAEKAYAILQGQKFDLLIFDYNLPGESGVELTGRLRGAGHETPILLISGAPDKGAVIRTMQHSRTDFLSKPFDIRELLSVAQNLVSRVG